MAEASKIKNIKFTMAKYTDVYLFKFCEPKKKKTNLVNEKNVRIKMYVGDGHGISICYPFTISLLL